MIAFNSNFNNEDPIKKLQALLNKALEEELEEVKEIENEDFLHDYLTEDFLNISDLIDIVYNNLYQENYSKINLSISKNKNDSLDIQVTHLS